MSIVVNIKSMHPELRSLLEQNESDDCKTEVLLNCALIGAIILKTSKLSVSGIDAPIKDVCRIIESESTSTRSDITKQLDLIKDTLTVITQSVVKQVSTDVDKHLNKLQKANVPLMGCIDDLKYDVKVLSGNTNKSVTKGRIGESSLISSLRMYYPLASVEDMSKVNNQSDIRFSCKSLGLSNVWIEVKTYTNAVPTKEIEKFKNEMSCNDVQFGIFASTTSTITKHRILEIETLSHGGRLMYIPNAGIEGLMVVYGLMYLSEYNHKTTVISDKSADSDASHTSIKVMDTIQMEIESMSNLMVVYSKLRKSLEKTSRDIERTLKKSMTELDTNLQNFETQFEASLNKIKGILSVTN